MAKHAIDALNTLRNHAVALMHEGADSDPLITIARAEARATAIRLSEPVTKWLAPHLVRPVIAEHFRKEWKDSWDRLEECRQTKLWSFLPDSAAAMHLVSSNREDLSTLVQVITGHGFHNYHQFLCGKLILISVAFVKVKANKLGT